MPEQQNIEYKQSWHDDYLKWVCGFANAVGGVIYIGKNDSGNVVHLADYKSLMDTNPVYITDESGKETFYIRRRASTIDLKPSETAKYIKMHLSLIHI